MIRLRRVALLVALTSSGSAASIGAQQFYSRARQMIADQVSIELGVVAVANDPRLTNAGVILDSLFAPTSTLSVWRGYVGGESQATQFLIGEVKGEQRPLALGGFPECHIQEFSEMLGARVANLVDALRLARLFVTVADPNGAHELLSPSDQTTTAEVPTRMHEVLPAYWPQDTALVLRGGEFYVRRTVLSHITTGGYGKPWRVIGYAFMIDSRGRVLSWHTREGPLITLSDSIRGEPMFQRVP